MKTDSLDNQVDTILSKRAMLQTTLRKDIDKISLNLSDECEIDSTV